MGVTFRNATVYMRPEGQPLAAISTEPATAAGSVTVNGQAAGTSGGGGLSSGAIAGIVIGAIAGVLLLAALAAFGFLRLRKRRQQEAADSRKLDGGMVKPVQTQAHRTNGSNGSMNRWATWPSMLGQVLWARLGCVVIGKPWTNAVAWRRACAASTQQAVPHA